MSKKWKFILSLTLILAVGMAFVQRQDDIYFLIKKNFSIFSKTYENVALDYVDEVDPEKLMRIGIDAMLETLDPYTIVYSESQVEQAEILSKGHYAGIGVEIGYREEKIVVIAPTDGGPAQKKGIKPGDEIIAIDGVSTINLQPEEVQNLTVGEVGSKIKLTIKRLSVDNEIEFELTRERIEVNNVTYNGYIGDTNETAYIKLAQFGENSAEEVRVALKELTDNKKVNGLVFDLRDNPGGILQEAVAIIDKFIEPGLTVVENRGRKHEYNEVFETKEPIMFEAPVIILMNGGSASASEVVAGALQDLDRAVIMGEKSFGKGLVQIVKQLPYNTSMKVTIARYYTPSGRSIQSIDYTHEGRNSGIIKSNNSSKLFKTRNGRDVYEGRGIEPDIQIKPEAPSMQQIALLQKGMYFDFATQYYSEHPNDTFSELPANIYRDFLQYLDANNFDYETNYEKELKILKEDVKHISGATKKINELEQLIVTDKIKQQETEKNIIEENLYIEILSRYVSHKERLKAELKNDKQVKEALELIQNPNKIETLLIGS